MPKTRRKTRKRDARGRFVAAKPAVSARKKPAKKVSETRPKKPGKVSWETVLLRAFPRGAVYEKETQRSIGVVIHRCYIDTRLLVGFQPTVEKALDHPALREWIPRVRAPKERHGYMRRYHGLMHVITPVGDLALIASITNVGTEKVFSDNEMFARAYKRSNASSHVRMFLEGFTRWLALCGAEPAAESLLIETIGIELVIKELESAPF